MKPVRALLMGALAAVAVVALDMSGAAAQQQARGPVAAMPRARGGVTFTSPEVAYEHGRSALKAGHPEIAIPAFEFAAANDVFLAQFSLARLYADNALSFTNHARAFELYQDIVTEHADVDVDDDPRAPFVAKSMIALAGYYRIGVRDAGVGVDLEQAANLLRNAAKTFRDEDAQYEFAKILLTGEGLGANPREAVYWLRGLSTRGHTGAQAFLADLYWRGQYVPKDPTQALALITLAAEYANLADRVWIEDKYQNIFCGAGEGVRRQAQGAVADWRSKYARSKDEGPSRDGLEPIQPRAVRTCSNGEPALPQRRGEARSDISAGLRPASPPTGAAVPADSFMQGSTSVPGLSLAPGR